MAQQRNQADDLKFCCPICLDLLKDPLTIPCGHNYCMSCIKTHWNGEYHRSYSCPQCRQSFTPRPVLVKNTLLAELVEDLKQTLLQAAPADHCYAEPGDVACDVCTGRKLKALKFCLVCMISYCEQHLQPHYESPALKNHKLVKSTDSLQDAICSRHHEVMRMFCRTDQQCICYRCSMDAHKGHDTVSAAAERTEKQKELGESRQKVQQRIHYRTKDVKVLQQEVEAINRSADKVVEHSEKTFAELIRLIQKRSSDVTQRIRRRQQTLVQQTKDLQKKLDQEIAELKRTVVDLDFLSRTEDHTQFLHSLTSLANLLASTDAQRPKVSNLPYFQDVMASVIAARDKLQAVFHDNWMRPTNVSLFQAEPKTRDEFLQYSCEITLDPNTAGDDLVLSDGNRKITRGFNLQSTMSNHPDKFRNDHQVLSKDGLTGRGYCEVEMSSYTSVAVAYKSIPRSDIISCRFGCNKKSWSLQFDSSYTFKHENKEIPVSGPLSSRIGVYLDHSAGVLSFYSVSETKTMTLLHRVQTKFTEPLYAGLALEVHNGGLYALSLGLYSGHTAEFCELE